MNRLAVKKLNLKISDFHKVVPLLVVTAIIFILSHIPFRVDELPFPSMDKIVHVVLYAVVASTVLYMLPAGLKRKPFVGGLIVMTICLLLGLGDEYHQKFVAERSPEGKDLAADLLGVLLCCIGWYVFFRKSNRCNF